MPEQRHRDDGDLGAGGGDDQLLAAVRRAYVTHDAPPATLAERVLFAIRLEDLDVEVARLVEDLLVPAGARGEEPARTITFSSSSLTVTITITPADSGHSRIDGWVAPAGRHRVEVRRTAGHGSGGHGSGVPDTYTDDAGRFVLADVPPGLVQLVLYPLEQDESGQVVAAPPLEL